MKQADDGAPIKVNQWRVAIADIEKRNRLSFGDSVRNADTISIPGQPTVGEAQRLITEFDDIKFERVGREASAP